MTTTFVTSPISGVDTYGEDSIVTITGGTTTAVLSGFTVTGPLDVPCNNGPGGGTGTLGNGIFVAEGATAIITNNVITEIHNTPIVQCAAYGVGILVGRASPPGTFSTTGTATISGNSISDYQNGAIVVQPLTRGSEARIFSVIWAAGPRRTPFA